MKERRWLTFALVTTLFWGVWGALIEIPEKNGFPATLGYIAWAITMIPCALVALSLVDWKLERDRRSIVLGSLVGFLGAGGQLVLFLALRLGPAYLVFPIVSLYPVVTIALSVAFLKERASARAWAGIALALAAIVLLSYAPAGTPIQGGYLWLAMAFAVFASWGVQAYVMKFATRTMRAESIFFYMMATGLVLVPFSLWMTDFSRDVYLGLGGPPLAMAIQVLNSIGALTLVYAVRYGKAIIVVPMTSLAPVITIVLSLALYRVIPGPMLVAGMIIACVAIYLMAE